MIWVVLPAYNEEEAISPLLDSLVENLSEANLPFRIFAVDDGSTDRTAQVIQRHSAADDRVTLLSNKRNLGLAETLKYGLMEASRLSAPKDIIVTMDADNTHPTGLVLRMARIIKEGNDIVIASRYREGSYVRGLSLPRRILSYGASWLFRCFFPTPGVRDYTCGFRAYRAEALQHVIAKFGAEFISERGFACMVDLLLRLRSEGFIFTEVPMVLRYDLKPGSSKMNVMLTVTETLKLLVRRRLDLGSKT